MEDKRPGIIRRSFGRLMAIISWLRGLLVNLFFVFFVVLLVVVLSSSELPTIPKQGALIVNLNGQLVDQLSYVDPLLLLMGDSDSGQQETLVSDVITAIGYARDDDRINSLVLRLDHLVYGGISKMQEISVALQAFRESGKKIIAVGDNYSQDQYWLAAQADEIYIHPLGGVSLQGYGTYRNYYKQALDKLKIDVHVFRAGEYKSAMEPYMRNDMSPAARDSNLKWLTSLWGEYAGAVASKRQLSLEDIDNYINNIDKLMQEYHGDSAKLALAAGFVDGIKTRDQSNQYLANIVGSVDEEGFYEGIDFEQYLWLKEIELPALTSEDVVGVIIAAGTIVDGERPPGEIGGDTLAQLIRQARRDDTVRSVVLRVDSGGGSMFASEIIRRELELLKAQGKPLVISMGSLAASGGYWISALADEIWATPTTLTGSIGVFGFFPTLDQSLATLGVSTDGVGTSDVAGSMRLDRPLMAITERAIQSSVENSYARFIGLVAAGRDMETSQVESIASGRVWSGTDAQANGLVDKLGGLDQAVAAAASLSDLESYQIETIELPLSPQEQLLNELMGSVQIKALIERRSSSSFKILSQVQQMLAPFSSGLNFIDSMNDPKGLYLHCSGCVAP